MNENNHDHDSQGFLAGAILGALAGSVAALLLTPKNGKEMRETFLEHTEGWGDEAGDLAKEAKRAITALNGVLQDGTQEAVKRAPEAIATATHTATTVAGKANDTYEGSRDTVSEMVETFKSQWAELEEHEGVVEEAPAAQAAASRYRGVHRTWEEASAIEDEKANQVYVEELEETVEEAARPTLAEIRRGTPVKKTEDKKVEDKEPKKSKAEEEAKKKSGPRKSLFKR